MNTRHLAMGLCVVVLGGAGVAAFRGVSTAIDPVAPAPSAIPAQTASDASSAPPAIVDAAKYPDLQAALDAVPESGGLVRLPPGEFRVERPLVLSRSDTRVEGAGAATRIINCNQQGQPAMIVRPAHAGKDRKARLWRVQLANFRIQGDPNAIDAKSTKPSSGDGLLAEQVDELYVHGLSIDHNGGHGIHLVHCYEDPRIADSIITYNAQAGVNIVGGHDIVVAANQFEENQDALRCIDSFNLCMTGNNIDDHLRDGVVIENTYGSVLSGNMIEECQGRAIVLDRDCYGITISANVLADNFGGGVDLRDAWGCTVSANTFTIVAVRALVVGPASGRITITGNNFSNSFIGEKTKRPGKQDLATGILLEGTRDVTITGNIFSGLAQEAIQADDQCERIVIAGNLVTDVGRAGEPKPPALDLRGAKQVAAGINLLDSPPPTEQK